MLDIMKSIYDMMGKYTYPTMQDDAPREHVENFFQVNKQTNRNDCKCALLLFVIIKSLADGFFFSPFQKMDRNKDGVVTIEEFIESCKKVKHL